MPRIKNNLGPILILAISFIPLILWFSIKPFNERFDNFTITIINIGRIAGLLGMALFASVLVLSARLKFLENYFGGLNKMYAWHHFFGGVALALLLFHPLLLTAKYIPQSLDKAVLMFIPVGNWPNNFGIFALYLMIILLVFTFYIRPRYHVWKLSHKFFGLAFFFAGLHAFLIPSDISRYLPLKIYMLILAGMGLTAFFYRSVFGRLLVKKFSYAVENIRALNNDILEIEMRPRNKKINFSPGQFVFAIFHSHGLKIEEHPFSIISSPQENNLKITIKSLGDYTSILRDKIKKGDAVKIEGPFGMLFSNGESNNKNQVWIAGGIGVTPFLSAAKDLKSNNKIDLYYCVNNKEEAVYLDILSEISYNNNNFRIIPFYSKEFGFITADLIKKTSGNLESKEIFLCGPPTMMKSLKKQFKKLGINENPIHSEEFNL
jgi:predicted ferric reductase